MESTRQIVLAARSRRAGGSLLRRLLALGALRRQRRQLALLDEAQLDDIGLHRPEARREADRPFWDPPSHWRH